MKIRRDHTITLEQVIGALQWPGVPAPSDDYRTFAAEQGRMEEGAAP